MALISLFMIAMCRPDKNKYILYCVHSIKTYGEEAVLLYRMITLAPSTIRPLKERLMSKTRYLTAPLSR